MAKDNPQLEDGYMRIANYLTEGILLSNLSKDELKITLAIMRRTYGYGKKMAAISVSLLQAMTGIDRRNVARALNSLLETQRIGRSQGAKMKYGKPVYNYWIIKKGYCQYDNSTMGNTTTETIVNMTTIKEKKEKLKERKKMMLKNFSMNK
jgi:phage replication O-like protein O